MLQPLEGQKLHSVVSQRYCNILLCQQLPSKIPKILPGQVTKTEHVDAVTAAEKGQKICFLITGTWKKIVSCIQLNIHRQQLVSVIPFSGLYSIYHTLCLKIITFVYCHISSSYKVFLKYGYCKKLMWVYWQGLKLLSFSQTTLDYSFTSTV